ncbi:MAG TPA: hypothetical protein VNJ70_05290 [Thermoanaerobaculia bacterium]|nr:hypothetical protein [Thermoanaerobaculia bacterium]
MTYPTDEFNVPRSAKAIAKFFAKEKAAGRKYRVKTRASGNLELA